MAIPEYFAEGRLGEIAPPVVPMGGATFGIPQQAASDPFAEPTSPEARAENYMTRQPDYVAGRAELDRVRGHQGRYDDLTDLAKQYSEHYGAGGTLDNEEAASPFGADGGMLTRMFTFHQRQDAARQAAKRATLKQGVEALKFMKELYDKGDETGLSLGGKYIGLGSDARDMTKAYVGNDARETRLDNAAAQLKIKQDAETRHALDSEQMRKYRAALTTILNGPHKDELMAKIRHLGLENEILGATGMDLARGKVLNEQVAPDIKMINALSGAGAATGTNQTALQNPLVQRVMQATAAAQAKKLSLTGGGQKGAIPGAIPPPEPVMINTPPPNAPQLNQLGPDIPQLSNTLSPKGQIAKENADAGNALKEEQTKATAAKTEEVNLKLMRKAKTTASAIYGTQGKSTVDYWRSPAGREEYKHLAEKSPEAAQQLIMMLKGQGAQ